MHFLSIGATVGFLMALYFIGEGAGAIELQIGVLEGAIGNDISVRLSTADGTAVGMIIQYTMLRKNIAKPHVCVLSLCPKSAPLDYVSTDVEFVLSTEIVSYVVEVPIVSDDVREVAELFYTRLELITPAANIDLAPLEAGVMIVDDDSKS